MISSDYKTEEQAQKYSNFRFNKGLNSISKDELSLLSKWLGHKSFNKQTTFVDIGTGTGRVLDTLLNYKSNIIIAVDQSNAMLSQLKKNYQKQIQSKKIRLVNHNSNNTGLKSNSVDVVTAFHLIKHLPETSSTFKEVARILKKEGIFIFDSLNKNSIIVYNLGSCVATSEGHLRNELKQNGLLVTRMVYIHPLGETIYAIPGIFLPIVRIVDFVISSVFPKFGTKIFIEAKKL